MLDPVPIIQGDSKFHGNILELRLTVKIGKTIHKNYILQLEKYDALMCAPRVK